MGKKMDYTSNVFLYAFPDFERGAVRMRISVKDMAFDYASTPVLHDITLDISGPQIVSIVGPNGVGKSTFIHCLNKILTPTEGSVMIEDRPVQDISIKDLSKVMGYVPCSSSTAFPLSVVDTVLMGRHPHSNWKTSDEDLDIVYDTLKLLEIDHLAMKPFNALSAGQHQKVMIARGLVQEPKYLLLDEPTSNLDVKHQMNVTRLLMNIAHEKGIIVVMISHDLNIAAAYSDNVIMMYGGSIYAVGTPTEVFTEENLQHVYEVKSRIIHENGRPHIILLDDEIDSCAPKLEGSTVTSA